MPEKFTPRHDTPGCSRRRAAQGRPWIFREIAHFLATGEHLPAPEVLEIRSVLLDHMQEHYAFYGEYSGVRIARKHIAWYTRGLSDANAFRQAMYQLDNTAAQRQAVADYFSARAAQQEHWHTHAVLEPVQS